MWNGWYNSRYFGMDSLIDCDVNVAVGQVGLGVVQVVQGLKITGTDSNISRLASRWTGVMRRREQMLCNYRTWVFSSFPKLFVLTYYLSENTLNHHGLISVFLYHFFPSLSLSASFHNGALFSNRCAHLQCRGWFPTRVGAVQWISPVRTKLSAVPLCHDLMRLVNKSSQITSERREGGRLLVLYCIHTNSQAKSMNQSLI